MNSIEKALFVFVISSFFISCSTSETQDPKIRFDLSEFTADGLRERPKGEFTPINYEFCIPANDDTLNEVLQIDSTIEIMKGSKGRSGCTDNEWLCIGSSHQPGFKKVIRNLAKLSYIRKISETFWE